MSACRNAWLRTIRSVMSTRQPALQRLGQKPLQGGARQNLLDEPLRSLGFACRRCLPIEIGARERLGHDPLDDPMLDERPRDRFRQRAREDTVDHLLRLGRREHLPGHGLEPPARVDLGASARSGRDPRWDFETVRRVVSVRPPAQGRAPAGRRRPDPAGRHDQTHDDVSPVRRPLHAASLADARPDSKRGAISLVKPRRTAPRRRVERRATRRLVFVLGPGLALLALPSRPERRRDCRDRARLALDSAGAAVLALPGGRRLGGGGRRSSFRPLRLLERVEALLERGHAARERIDRAQLRRGVVEPFAYAVITPATARRGRSTRRRSASSPASASLEMASASCVFLVPPRRRQ